MVVVSALYLSINVGLRPGARHRRRARARRSSPRPLAQARRSAPAGEARRLGRDLPLGGRLRERDDPPDAAQLLRDGRGRRPAASLPAREPEDAGAGAGLAFFAATMLIPAFFLGSFEKLLSYVIFTDSLMLVVVASTIFVLRKRGEGGDGAFRIPGYPSSRALRPRPRRRRRARRRNRAPPRARGRRDPARGVAAVHPRPPVEPGPRSGRRDRDEGPATSDFPLEHGVTTVSLAAAQPASKSSSG